MRDLRATPLTMLVVEDEAIPGTVLVRMLRRSWPDADVRLVESGAAALEALTAQPADVVLTDLIMPEMNGVALTRAIKARWPTTPVILVSGSSLEELSRAAQEAQADCYLEKPYTRAQLERIIQDVLV
jgi:CheY-like chemotaxis protein